MLEGKYSNIKDFYLAKFRRSLLRLVLRPIFSWEKLDNPKPGYTISIPSHWRFPRMLEACLSFVSQQDLTHMDCVVCAIDSPANPTWDSEENRLKSKFPELNLKFVYQTPLQSRVLRIINWGWVDAWLSFCKGIATAKTRYVFQHDNDAMLLNRSLMETRYRTIVERGDVFVTGRWYQGNGLEVSDRIAYTAELIFDAQFLRNTCYPIECFNYVCFFNGKTVDFDVLHQCQLKTDRRSILPIDWEKDWVHPSQVISQFTYLARAKSWLAPDTNNLFFIPYFEYLGGNHNALKEVTDALIKSQDKRIDFFGYQMDITNLSEIHMDWIIQQIGKLEKDQFGSNRPEVESYLQAIEAHVRGCHKDPLESIQHPVTLVAD